MGSKRKSFLLHFDSLSVLDDLSDEQAGKLFKAMKAYHFGEEVELDSLVKVAFSPFKNQFVRDEEKYEKTCKARAEAGSKGGKQKQQNLANASKSKQSLANLADSDSKNKSDSDSDSDSEKNINTSQKPKVVCPHNEILNLWDEVMPSHITRHRASLWRNNPGYNNLKQRWEEMKKYERQDGKVGYETQAEGLEFWRHLFNHLTNSDFMMNEWKPSLADILVKSKFYPALEGKYHASRQH